MQPKTNGECALCLDDARLLMPLTIETCYGGPVTVPACMNCRLNWRDDENACLASTIAHSKYRWNFVRGLISEGETLAADEALRNPVLLDSMIAAQLAAA